MISNEDLVKLAFENNIVCIDNLNTRNTFSPRLLRILNNCFKSQFKQEYTDIRHIDNGITIYKELDGYIHEHLKFRDEELDLDLCIAYDSERPELSILGMY